MRRAAVFLAIAALLAVPAAALAHEEMFSADLSAADEVPAPTVPSGYEGTGSATVTISEDHTTISYNVSFSGLTGDPVGAHIHWGPVGSAGPIILPLDHTTNPMTGNLTEADFQPAEGGPQTFAEALEAMRAGDTYINIHTADNAPGEIRGQLTADELPDTAIGDAQVPGMPWTIVMAALGLGVLLLVTRRFATRLG